MIIFLNGTSSSGKTSIANELLQKLEDPYFYFSVDKFLEPSMPLKINMDFKKDMEIIERAISGFNRALQAYVESIDFMIVDHVLHHKSWLNDVARALSHSEVFFVGITAPLQVLEERESTRADRQCGTAKAQFDLISSYQYDLVIDTSEFSPFVAAEKIIRNLRAGSALQYSAANIV